MDYVTLQAHIEEARNAGALEMLLIPANVELMVLPLSTWEKRIWREAQGIGGGKRTFFRSALLLSVTAMTFAFLPNNPGRLPTVSPSSALRGRRSLGPVERSRLGKHMP